MSIDIDSLGITQLSVAQRLELIEQIWDSLPESVAPEEVPDWHLPILAERRAEMDREPHTGKPWREVFDRLQGES
jgi:putative addiction module component (TIGR02574 family)